MYTGYKPKRGFEQDADAIAWSKEANVWATFYMDFNDDNETHMEDSFRNQGLYNMGADELHQQNIGWIQTIGLDTFRQYNTEPNLEPYGAEFEANMAKSKRENRIKQAEALFDHESSVDNPGYEMD